MGYNSRASGLLLHITSLPSAFGIGDLGPESYRFVDLLVKSKQHYWSILPLSPTRWEDGNSPYQSSSAFAGTPLLLSVEKLVEDGLLSKEYLNKGIKPTGRVDYRWVYLNKEAIIDEAYANAKKKGNSLLKLDDFMAENSSWLVDYAIYTALRKKSGIPWHQWPMPLRKREKQAIDKKKQELKEEIQKAIFIQHQFLSQWSQLKDYCKKNEINIIGDMPFYVAYDSVDVWANQKNFKLKATGEAKFVGGVPPDYFSATGQLWGNPVFNWKRMQQVGFEWWIQRIGQSLKFYDKLRLDHFRGFVAYWQVNAEAKTAKNGRWIKAPSEAFFDAIKKAFPKMPFIAEDLGEIDKPVEDMVAKLKIPGMRVLLFGFDGSKSNPHLLRNHNENSVVYTGTHDTNTVKGWFTSEASPKQKKVLFKQLGKQVTKEAVSFELVRLALSSKANLSIIPIQDVLSLGSEARMNNPSIPLGNWEWRVTSNQLLNGKFNELAEAIIKNKRAN